MNVIDSKGRVWSREKLRNLIERDRSVDPSGWNFKSDDEREILSSLLFRFSESSARIKNSARR